jgi:VCBS repeat-containing protein
LEHIVKSRQQKKRIVARRRFLGLESLERREVLAGNVSAVIQGGDLFVNGDSLGNDITITRSGPSSVTITGNGTTVNGQTSLTLGNFQRNITVDLGIGNDVVNFKRTADDLFRIFGGLEVNTSGGNDRVNFTDTEVQGLLFVDTGSGNDQVNATPGTSGWGLRVLKVGSILAGSGDDVVSLDRARFERASSILLEDGNDNLFLRNSEFIRSTLIDGGNGFDLLNTVSTYLPKEPLVVLFESRGSNPPPPPNTPPVAVNDAATLAEGGTLSINVPANDTDVGGSLNLTSVVITQNPTHGSVTVNSNGTVTYTHNGSETTSDSFRYTIKDNLGAVSGTATVAITVTPVNDAPVAVNDTATVAEGATLSIPVSTNDTDVDGTIDPTSIVITQNPGNGTVVVNANGSVSYTHNGSETTSDSFKYTIKDNSGAVSGTATVTITVTPVNDAPVAVNDTATLAEGATLAIPVSTNDTDADGTIDLTSIVITQNPANGSAVVNANGSVTYTHNGSETTSDSFRYTIKDNSGAVSGTATVSITVTPVNDTPVAVNDTATVAEGAVLAIPVSTNDTDADGTIDATSIVVIQNPAHGTAVANATGTVTYTHDSSNTTSDSFTYTIKDNSGAVSGTATVAITVSPVNDPPVAVNDVLTVNEGTGGSVNVASNDTDSDGTIDLASIVIIQNPAHGTAVANANGTVTYTHDGSETVNDSFTYTIKDGLGAVSGTATVAITATPVNDVPVAVNDVLTVAEGAGGNVNVSTNDTDADGTIDIASIAIAQNPTHGTAIANADGTVTYTHDGSETTNDSFTYTIKDNNGLVSGIATVTVTVTPVNDAPVAVNDVLTVAEGTGGNANVSTNDTDVDGTIDVTTVVITQIPAHGTAVANANGTVTYTHDGSETTSDSFTYTIKDNNGLVSGTATVAVTVNPVNDAPVAVNDVLTVNEGAGGSVNVSTNDTDADGTIDIATVVIVQGPAHGTAVANADGTVTYTHNGSETTSDSFTYTIKDNNGLVSGTATVAVTVNPVNDAPVAVNDVLTVAEGVGENVNVSSNDTDADGTIDLTSIVVTQNPTHGTAVANADGTVTYTHDGSETTSDSFTYTIKDNNGLVSGTATVAVMVAPINDAPVAVNDVLTVNEGAGGSVNVSMNDTDVDGTVDVTTIVITQNPAHGTAVANADGTVTYTHDGSETTADSFTYTIKDNQGLVSGTATVAVTVTPVNDAPVSVNDVLTMAEGGINSVNVSTNDTDVDGTIDIATVVITQNPAHGTAVANIDGTVTYTHDGSETTSDSFTYTIKDNNGLVSGAATVAVTVTPVNDAPVAVNNEFTIDEDESLNLAAPGVLGNDTDAEGNSLTASLVSGPLHGSLSLGANGSVMYTPDLNFHGTDGFSYLVNDGLADSAVAAVTITVVSVNDAPVATNDATTVSEAGPTSIDLAANDTDVDGTIDLGTIVIIQNPANGNVVVNGDGTVSYMHDGSVTTSDSFTYIIKDNDGLVSGTATVNITVTPVNDAPVPVNDSSTVSEGGTASINLAANDTDVDGTIDVTTIVVSQNPGHGNVVVNGDGTVSYTHDGSETTSDSFTYTIKDNNGQVSATATVNITVTPVNDPPVAIGDPASVANGSAVIINVAANDTDADNSLDLTSIQISQQPINGILVVNGDGTVTYTHDGSATASDSFQYTIKDASGAVSNVATVTITIT